MLYFEKDCPKASLSGALPRSKYKALWFNPRTGDWIGAGVLGADSTGKITLPSFPDKSTRSNSDWALKLTLRGARWAQESAGIIWIPAGVYPAL